MKLKTLVSILAILTLPAFAEPVGTVSNDGEIAKVLTTINDGEIDAAKIELKQGKNADARAFAKTMISQHKENMKDTKDLAKANSLDIKDSDLSKSVKTDAKSNNEDLKNANKAAVDQAYVKEQVQMHEGALKIIDGTLLPKVENANLRSHLTKTRAAVAQHLEHAKALEAKL
jgi:putative membrane protein